MAKFENGDIVSVNRDVTIMGINSDERYVITPDMCLTVVVPFKAYDGIEAYLVDVGKFATPMLEDNLVLVEKHSDERPATEDAPADGRDKVLYHITNKLGTFYAYRIRSTKPPSCCRSAWTRRTTDSVANAKSEALKSSPPNTSSMASSRSRETMEG